MASESTADKRRTWALPGWLRGLAMLALLAGGLTALGRGLAYTASPVIIDVDGRPVVIRTHATVVRDVLRDAGISYFPEDRISPDLDAPLQAGRPISIRRARPFTIRVDGGVQHIRTHGTTAGEVLSSAGVHVGPGDEIWLDFPAWGGIGTRRRVEAATPVDAAGPGRAVSHRGGLRLKPAAASPEPPVITLRRAARLTLQDGGAKSTLYTTASTVGQVLQDAGTVLFLGDRVTPGLQQRVTSGMSVVIERSIPVQIAVDGHVIHTRTRARTVAGALGQEGIALANKDRAVPALDAPLQAGVTIRITRVHESLEVEFHPIPFNTIWVPDPELEIDHRRVVQEGQIGVTKRRYRIVVEDGREVSRTLEDAWTEQSPITRTLAYGTKIVIRTLDTPDGPIEYWRKIRAYAVSYTAASSGKDKTHPRYGYTRLGVKATKGVVAVDPTVIPLRSRIYVPGYGPAIAADTGGGVKGKLIDLCFDVGAYQSWHWWVDIYLLTPVPPRGQIRWLLPDWPKFPDRGR